MTLEEAIQHLRESLADPTHKWGCEECKQEHIQLLVWLESYKDISVSYPKVKEYLASLKEENYQLLKSNLTLVERCGILEAENTKLKYLLTEAIDDLRNISCDGICSCCSLDGATCEWKHHDEAMELLGG